VICAADAGVATVMGFARFRDTGVDSPGSCSVEVVA